MQYTINSKRTFLILFLENLSPMTTELSLEQICENENDTYEYIYAMQENIDPILDLKIGEKLQMKFNRDNGDSDGFVKRIA